MSSTSDDSSSSSASEEDEVPLMEVSFQHDGHVNSAPFAILRQQEWSYRWFGSSASPTRIRRIFLRPLLVFVIGFVYVQRRSIAAEEKPRTQPRPSEDIEKDTSTYWWTSTTTSSSEPSANLEFQFANETHESSASTSLEDHSHSNSKSRESRGKDLSSHLQQHAFHPPYFPRHVPQLAEEEEDPDADPETFGWEPSQYPNPRENPQQCGIAYLLQEEVYSSQNLQLCDPDWVLGGIYLEEIALAMKNFVQTYSSPPPPVATNTPPSFVMQPPIRRRRILEEEEEDGEVDKDGWDVVDADYLVEVPSPNDKIAHPVEETTNVANSEEGQDSTAVPVVSEASPPFVELAIATVRKMHVSAVLEHGIYYSYEDEEDMVSDAAQIFARYLHDQWWQGNSNGQYGILIFLSIQDRVCFISTGSAITTVLPWWRLEHIVSSMKPDLRHRDYGHALLTAIHDLSDMLAAGPPTMGDRFHDFMARFGVVIAFAIFTFFFGAWGEFRDRRKRWEYAESRSKMSHVEREKARLLQREFKTKSCPICLENFDDGLDIEGEPSSELALENEYKQDQYADELDGDTGCQCCCARKAKTKQNTESKEEPKKSALRRVDSYGIPIMGADHHNVKMLRCGHIFCDSCWKEWVHSGQGNPCICPVCRQDVGKSSKRRRRRQQQEQQQQQEAAQAEAASAQVTNSDRTPLMNNTSTRLSTGGGSGTYDSMSSSIDEDTEYGSTSRSSLFPSQQQTLSEGPGRASLPESNSARSRNNNSGEGENREGDQQGEAQSLLRNGPRRAQRNWFMS